jgi:hypothetical protein
MKKYEWHVGVLTTVIDFKVSHSDLITVSKNEIDVTYFTGTRFFFAKLTTKREAR